MTQAEIRALAIAFLAQDATVDGWWWCPTGKHRYGLGHDPEPEPALRDDLLMPRVCDLHPLPRKRRAKRGKDRF